MESITTAANVLEVSEYEVFRRGHLEWYGVPPSPRALDHHYGRYLRGGCVPFWARRFAERVVAEFDRGRSSSAHAPGTVFWA